MRPVILFPLAPLLLCATLSAQVLPSSSQSLENQVENSLSTGIEVQEISVPLLFESVDMTLHRALLATTNRLLRTSSRVADSKFYYSSDSSKRTDPMSDEKYKDVKNWEVRRLDPRDYTPVFINDHITPEYASYDPPRGFTAEEIMKFAGAKTVFSSMSEAENLIQLREKYGTLQGEVES
ncbi:hypothetical protein C8R42DRAFT_641969 [Lentinula raphanica]|nr:hypothetical protein C8R42DRAFT_641969 [Lentinula raphanica]